MYLGFSCDKALCYTLEISKFCRLYRQKKITSLTKAQLSNISRGKIF